MFSGVRPGNPFYILEKQGEPRLRIGQVVQASNPQPSFDQPFQQYVDVKVSVDGDTVEFKKLPASASIADSGGIVVSDNRETLGGEVASMVQASRSILDKVDYHRKVVEKCDEMMRMLDPKLAKEKERDDDISNLKSKMGGLEDKMDRILTILQDRK